MRLEFIELESFTLTADGVMTDADLASVEDELLENPEAGDRIPGTGGVRKIRAAIGGRGKRGGARVLYYLCHPSLSDLLHCGLREESSVHAQRKRQEGNANAHSNIG